MKLKEQDYLLLLDKLGESQSTTDISNGLLIVTTAASNPLCKIRLSMTPRGEVIVNFRRGTWPFRIIGRYDSLEQFKQIYDQLFGRITDEPNSRTNLPD